MIFVKIYVAGFVVFVLTILLGQVFRPRELDRYDLAVFAAATIFWPFTMVWFLSDSVRGKLS